jgi:uncharacterized protein (DUF2147 family)
MLQAWRTSSGPQGKKSAIRAWAGPTSALFILLYSSQAWPAPTDPAGLWSTKDDESIIKIAPCGTNYCGTLVWLKEPNEPNGKPKLDHYNKDKTKRTRPMVGIDLLLDLAADGDHWRGKAYNPEDGETYDITFKVDAGSKGPGPGDKAEIEGCLMRILCKTENFTRAPAIPLPNPGSGLSSGAARAR